MFAAFSIRSGVAGCDDRKSSERGSELLADRKPPKLLMEVRKRDRPMRIIARPRGDADADAVRLELLRAREARKGELRFRERERARRIVHRADGRIGDDGRAARLAFADFGMMSDDMRHFMREHAREFGVVIGERKQAARDVKLAGLQCESVDRRRIENRHLEALLGPLRRRDEPIDHAGDHRFELRIGIGSAIGGENAPVLALLGGGGLALLDRIRHADRPVDIDERRAGGKQHGKRNGERSGDRPPG